MPATPILIPFTRNFIANYANAGRTDGGYLTTYAPFALEEVLHLFPELLTAVGRARLKAELTARKHRLPTPPYYTPDGREITA